MIISGDKSDMPDRDSSGRSLSTRSNSEVSYPPSRRILPLHTPDESSDHSATDPLLIPTEHELSTAHYDHGIVDWTKKEISQYMNTPEVKSKVRFAGAGFWAFITYLALGAFLGPGLIMSLWSQNHDHSRDAEGPPPPHLSGGSSGALLPGSGAGRVEMWQAYKRENFALEFSQGFQDVSLDINWWSPENEFVSSDHNSRHPGIWQATSAFFANLFHHESTQMMLHHLITPLQPLRLLHNTPQPTLDPTSSVAKRSIQSQNLRFVRSFAAAHPFSRELKKAFCPLLFPFPVLRKSTPNWLSSTLKNYLPCSQVLGEVITSGGGPPTPPPDQEETRGPTGHSTEKRSRHKHHHRPRLYLLPSSPIGLNHLSSEQGVVVGWDDEQGVLIVSPACSTFDRSKFRSWSNHTENKLAERVHELQYLPEDEPEGPPRLGDKPSPPHGSNKEFVPKICMPRLRLSLIIPTTLSAGYGMSLTSNSPTAINVSSTSDYKWGVIKFALMSASSSIDVSGLTAESLQLSLGDSSEEFAAKIATQMQDIASQVSDIQVKYPGVVDG